MTKGEIEAVFARVRTWPKDRQDELVRVIDEIEREGADIYVLDDDEIAALDEAEASGDATAEQVEAVFARYKA